MEYIFKKNIFGQMVLYVKFRYPGYFPGCWKYDYIKADEADVAKLLCRLDKIKETARPLPPGNE